MLNTILCRIGRRGFCARLLWIWLVSLDASLAASTPATLGVLSYRPKPVTEARWQATVDYLSKQTGHPFRLAAMNYAELELAVEQGRIDFVLTNPSHYALMSRRNGLSSPLATLIELENDQPLARFGGVIVVRSDRSELQQITDLRGKIIATPDIGSLGGYQLQAQALVRQGLSLPGDVILKITGMPHDRVLEAVLSGEADAGFVRTGVIESLSRAGRLDSARLRVLATRVEPGFPFVVSTALFPEWPIAALPHTDPGLAQRVTKALFSLHPEHPAVRAGGYHGWTIPADYEPVRALLQELRLPPFEGPPSFTVEDVLAKHGLSIAMGLTGIAAILILLMMLVRRQRQLHLQEQRLAEERGQLLAALGEGVYGVDTTGRCIFINPAALAMLGYSAEEMLGQDQHAMTHHQRPDKSPYPHSECPIHKTLHDGHTRRLEEWFWRKGGEGFPVEMTVAPLPTGAESRGAVVVFRDIRERLIAQERDRLLVTALEAAANGIVITDAEGRIEWTNPAFERLTGYTRAEAIGRRPAELVKSGLQDEAFYEAMWQSILSGRTWRGELVNKRRSGVLYHEELIIAPVPDDAGRIAHFVGIMQDISERKRMEAELHVLASTDPLTGLANRRQFMIWVEDELARIKRFGQTDASLLMLDLDHFKRINDSHGHAAGDAVLCAFARTIAGQLRQTDRAGRLGGEEFAILLVGTDLDGAEEFAERLRQETAAMRVASVAETLHVTVSIGISALHPDDASPDAVLHRADAALYRAKEAGRNRIARH